MRSILAGAVLMVGVVVLAVPARAQSASSPAEDLPRLTELRLADLPGDRGPVHPGVQDPVQAPVQVDDDDDDNNNGRDSLKNGTLTGLVIGGIIGALFAAECGHPECGPYISFFAGIGAAVGVGIDAMLTDRTLVPVETRRKPRLAPFERAVKVGVTKRW